MPRRLPLPLALLLLALCPAMAAAHAYPLAPAPGNPVMSATDPGAGLAVDDRGRVAVTVPLGTGTAVAVRAPGGAWTVAPLPGIDTPGDLLFTAGGGAVVGYGTADTHEYAGATYDEPRGGSPCCQRPFVFRWRPGAPPRRQAMVPLDSTDREVEAFAVDHDGTAYAILEQEDSEDVSPDITLAAVRVPARGAPARRALPTDGSIIGYSVSLRASERGAGATVAWNDDTAMRRLTATPGGWRAIGHPAPAPQNSVQTVYLDPRLRPIHVVEHARHLTLRVAAGRQQRLGTLGPHAGWQAAMGADGTLAILWTTQGSVLHERVVDRAGRLGPTRDLGTIAPPPHATYDVAIDARGGVHVAWAQPGGTVVVQAPGSRRVLSRDGAPLELYDLAVSPNGATAAVVTAGPQRLVAVTTRP
ncbi:MAG TPA: hypothetical protein VGM33_05070 [Baekduia sp.]|jgi:hypothetical protein